MPGRTALACEGRGCAGDRGAVTMSGGAVWWLRATAAIPPNAPSAPSPVPSPAPSPPPCTEPTALHQVGRSFWGCRPFGARRLASGVAVSWRACRSALRRRPFGLVTLHRGRCPVSGLSPRSVATASYRVVPHATCRSLSAPPISLRRACGFGRFSPPGRRWSGGDGRRAIGLGALAGRSPSVGAPA